MSEKRPIPLSVVSPVDPRWEIVLRVADSVYFRKGQKLRAFLLYVCENTILGRLENVREQIIGSKVFGRPVDYQLSDDNIVRVEARELRKRLEAYFAKEGQAEPIVIEIPKGGYVPVFRHRDEAPLPPQTTEAGEPAVEAAPVEAAGRVRRWPVRAGAIVYAGLVVWLVLTVWLVVERQRLRQFNPGATGAGASSSEYAIYRELLGSLGSVPNRELQLVLCNPKLILFYGAPSPRPTWAKPGDMSAPKEFDGIFAPALNGKDKGMPYRRLRITGDTYTGIGEAMAACQIARLMDRLHRPVHLTQARFLNWDNVQDQDLILLGGPNSNGWSYQVEVASGFVFSGNTLVNLKPAAGEPKEYTADTVPQSSGALAEYGVLRMLTTPHGFKTCLLAGLSGGGTAGVAEFFTSPAKMKPLAERIAAAAPGKAFPSDWEAVMRIVVQDNVPVETSVVTVRPVRQ